MTRGVSKKNIKLKKNGNLNGFIKEYSHGRISSSGYFKNGKRKGIHKQYLHGKVAIKLYFKNDMLLRDIVFYGRKYWDTIYGGYNLPPVPSIDKHWHERI